MSCPSAGKESTTHENEQLRVMVVVLAKNQLPMKMSNYAHFRWRLVVVTLLVADVPLRLAFHAREGVCQCVSASALFNVTRSKEGLNPPGHVVVPANVCN